MINNIFEQELTKFYSAKGSENEPKYDPNEHFVDPRATRKIPMENGWYGPTQA